MRNPAASPSLKPAIALRSPSPIFPLPAKASSPPCASASTYCVRANMPATTTSPSPRISPKCSAAAMSHRALPSASSTCSTSSASTSSPCAASANRRSASPISSKPVSRCAIRIHLMRDAVIVSSVRTAVGKAPRGALRTTRPDDLGAIAVRGALDRVPQLDPREIDDVILGCAMPEAEQGMNVARVIAFRAGLPVESAAMTINRYCASGLQTIALAAERIRGGGAEVIVAGGAESMSYVPFGGNKISVNPWLVENFPGSYMSMGLTAERVAKHYGITREESDAFALSSHQKALAAIEAGRFQDEI